MINQASAQEAYMRGGAQSSAAPTVPPVPDNTVIGVSRGLRNWLVANKTSFAFSSYQSGRLMLVGAMPNGTVSVQQQTYTRAMGLCWKSNQLFLATRSEVWRLQNVLAPNQLAS